MSPENNPPPPPPPSTKPSSKDDGGRKTAAARPPEQGLKCPRCDSPNTKFCYYNNYSLTQPRHFCKTCRRYWTKGGALRNVPIGGGCRKNKKVKSSSSSSSSRFPGDPMGSPELGGFKFLHSLSPSSMDFNLSGSSSSSFPRLHHHHHHHHHPSMYNQISSFENLQLQPPPSFETSNSNPMIMSNFNNNYPSTGFGGVIQGMSSMNVNSTLASSIESLSSVNQDLHWKLQQQRLAMLFGGDIDNDNDNNNNVNNQKSSDDGGAGGVTTSLEKPQPILFQNLEISKPESCGVGSRKDDMNINANNAPTEWFFGNSFASVIPTPASSNGGGGGSSVHGWSDVQQQQQPYNVLP